MNAIGSRRTALYRYFDAADRLLYVGISHCWASRAVQHRQAAKWFPSIVRMETQWFETRQAADAAETAAIQTEKPLYNVAKTRKGGSAPTVSARYPGTRSAKSVMLCWDPGSDRVTLVDWPDPQRKSNAYQGTTLACMMDVHDMTPAQLTTMCFVEAMHLIVRDKCDPMAVRRAMCGISEYQDGLSYDVPGAIEPEAC